MNVAFKPSATIQILSSEQPSPKKYWWVNQNQTYREEIFGSFLWSPQLKSNGHQNPFYNFMKEVRPGDVVFSFCDTKIKAIGIAIGPAEGAPKPAFIQGGVNWSNEGWLVPVDYTELTTPIRPKDHIEILRPTLPAKYSPLQNNGNGMQSAYLAHVPASMAKILINLIGKEYATITGSVNVVPYTTVDLQNEAVCDALEEGIVGRTDIGATMREQLVKARRGQGLFKINVRRNEKACRVTGVTDPRNLRASHIKPWKDCSDNEKLNGCNGFMLAPHVDHLFDKGFISFADNGDLIISPALDRSILQRWGIPEVLNVGSVLHQAAFLAYHRAYVLKK